MKKIAKKLEPIPVTVTCTKCGEEMDENHPDIHEMDITSDDLGRDVVYFTCPFCDKYTSSLRRG